MQRKSERGFDTQQRDCQMNLNPGSLQQPCSTKTTEVTGADHCHSNQ